MFHRLRVINYLSFLVLFMSGHSKFSLLSEIIPFISVAIKCLFGELHFLKLAVTGLQSLVRYTEENGELLCLSKCSLVACCFCKKKFFFKWSGGGGGGGWGFGRTCEYANPFHF